MRITSRIAVAAGAAGLAIVVAACSGTPTAKIGSGGTGPTGHMVRGGTVTIAEIGVSPNFIFPYAPATNSNGYNVNLTEPMWPPLVYLGDGAKSIVNPQESLFSSIIYSDGDKTITIGLKPWKWSDGQPITSRDFTFVYNLMKANYTNWNAFLTGLFPVNVTSVATPSSHTVVLHLTRSYNPNFYTEDVLSQIQLVPQHAWDKTSATGPVGNYDETTAGAKAVYSFLEKEGGQMPTFATNPLWQVVDGPWKLSAFQNTGYYSYVPNKNYSGPDKPVLSKVVNTPFTDDTAELEALRSGNVLDAGNLPQNDLGQESQLEAQGYTIASQPIPGVAEIVPNLYNATAGPLFRQLYIRQAMEDLINRPQLVSKVFAGYADPGNGPVPLSSGQWVSPLEKKGGPYPYSPSKAVALLKAHGWKVVPSGASTCTRAGTGPSDCGAGIVAGAQLSATLTYASGTAAFDEQNAAIQSSEEQGGIKITLKSLPFDSLVAQLGTCTAASHPASTCGWQLVQYGYDPYSLYPAGDGLFNSTGNNDSGGYANPEMDSLINATEYGSSTAAFYKYEDYAAEQLPWLWLPNSDNILVYRKNLAGFAPLNPFSGGLNPEVWYYTSGS